jgi:hypothetical protein
VFLGWLRGERGHCSMVAIPTLEEEDAKRPSRERESLVGERTRCVIQTIVGARFRGSWAAISEERGQRFHVIVGSPPTG